MPDTTATTLVMGIGNLLMGDEGIGVRLVQRLSETLGDAPDLEFLDVGSRLFSIPHCIKGRKQVLFLDCAYMGSDPGTIRVFTPEEARTRKSLPGTSLHEGDLLKVLELCNKVGFNSESVLIVGIEPDCVEPGDVLSPLLQERLESYVAKVSLVLESLNPSCG